MSNMQEVSDFYMVSVKIEEDLGLKKNGEPKIKKTTENYIVKAGSPQDASDKVETEMEGCISTWYINSVTLKKIVKVVE